MSTKLINELNSMTLYDTGFKKIQDKEVISKNQQFTRPCNNVLKSGTCTRKLCTFAHYKEQLKHPVCVFTNCKYFNVSNPKESTCKRVHEKYETIEQFRERIDFVMPDLPSMSTYNERTKMTVDDDDDVVVIIDEIEDKENKENFDNVIPPVHDNIWSENLTLKFNKNNIEYISPMVISAVQSGRTNITIKIEELDI